MVGLKTWFSPAKKASDPNTNATNADYAGFVNNRIGREWKDIISIFITGTDIIFDIIDTETITGTNDNEAIDFGAFPARKNEDGNKGIDKLFYKNPKNLRTTATATPDDTGHAAEWSPIHHPYYPSAILDIIDDATGKAAPKCGPSGKHWFKGGNSSGAQKNYYLWNTSWLAFIP